MVQITPKLNIPLFWKEETHRIKLATKNFIPKDGHRLAMDACGCTDPVELPCASHAWMHVDVQTLLSCHVPAMHGEKKRPTTRGRNS
jgi:hypothetical protein